MKRQFLMIFAYLTFVVFLPAASIGGVWRDDFNGTDIGPGWEVVNAPGQFTYEVADGWFSIDIAGINNVMLLRDGTEGDYTIETHILIEPDPNRDQQFGPTDRAWADINILDNTNVPSTDWWRTGRGGGGPGAVRVTYINGRDHGIVIHTEPVSDMELYLKAEKFGRLYTGYYKIGENGEWIEIGTDELKMNPLKVGLSLSTWAERSMVCNFDYFEITGEGVEPPAPVTRNKNLISTWVQLKRRWEN